MHMDSYEELAAETAVYPGFDTGKLEAVNYCTLGLLGEAGELANKLKKVIRDDGGNLTTAKRFEIATELGDVLWYVARLSNELGFSLESVASCNLDKLGARAARGTLQGSGDDR